MKPIPLRLLGVAAAALPLLLCGVFALRPPRPWPRLTDENFRKVCHGMTRQEVEALLGAPPGDYGRIHAVYCVNACQGSTCELLENFRHSRKPRRLKDVTPLSPGGEIVLWRDEKRAVAVEFDAGGKVACKGIGTGVSQPGTVERFREWLGLK
jgi:hypothetical protein